MNLFFRAKRFYAISEKLDLFLKPMVSTCNIIGIDA